MKTIFLDNLSTFPVLKTERLDLIEIKKDHLNDLFKLFGDDDVTKYYNIETLTQCSEAQKILDVFHKKFNDQLGIRWGIALKGRNNIIGTVGFNYFKKGHRSKYWL